MSNEEIMARNYFYDAKELIADFDFASATKEEREQFFNEIATALANARRCASNNALAGVKGKDNVRDIYNL